MRGMTIAVYAPCARPLASTAILSSLADTCSSIARLSADAMPASVDGSPVPTEAKTVWVVSVFAVLTPDPANTNVTLLVSALGNCSSSLSTTRDDSAKPMGQHTLRHELLAYVCSMLENFRWAH